MALLLDSKYSDVQGNVGKLVLEGDNVGLSVLIELLMIGLVCRLAQPPTATIKWPESDNQALIDCVVAAASSAGFEGAKDMQAHIKQAAYFARISNDGYIAKAMALADFLAIDLEARTLPAPTLAALESASATMAASGDDSQGLAAAALVLALNQSLAYA